MDSLSAMADKYIQFYRQSELVLYTRKINRKPSAMLWQTVISNPPLEPISIYPASKH